MHRSERLPAVFFWNFQLKASASLKELLMRNGKKQRPWAASEVREMKRLAKKKPPARKIARTLKRTEGATRQKAFSIWLSLESRA
jgi:hypothetical protein